MDINSTYCAGDHFMIYTHTHRIVMLYIWNEYNVIHRLYLNNNNKIIRKEWLWEYCLRFGHFCEIEKGKRNANSKVEQSRTRRRRCPTNLLEPWLDWVQWLLSQCSFQETPSPLFSHFHQGWRPLWKRDIWTARTHPDRISGNIANVLQGEERAGSLTRSGVQTLVSAWSPTGWVTPGI